jgi:LSD1 subclass zinc finger protein
MRRQSWAIRPCSLCCSRCLSDPRCSPDRRYPGRRPRPESHPWPTCRLCSAHLRRSSCRWWLSYPRCSSNCRCSGLHLLRPRHRWPRNLGFPYHRIQLQKPEQVLRSTTMPYGSSDPSQLRVQCFRLVYLCGAWLDYVIGYDRMHEPAMVAMFEVGSICDSSQVIAAQILAMAAPL